MIFALISVMGGSPWLELDGWILSYTVVHFQDLLSLV